MNNQQYSPKQISPFIISFDLCMFSLCLLLHFQVYLIINDPTFHEVSCVCFFLDFSFHYNILQNPVGFLWHHDSGHLLFRIQESWVRDTHIAVLF